MAKKYNQMVHLIKVEDDTPKERVITNEWTNDTFGKYRDSMCYDSGAEIMSCLVDGRYECEIRVDGNPGVVDRIGGGVYTAASEMPLDIFAQFRAGTAYGNPDIVISNRNRFVLAVTNRGTAKTLCCDVTVNFKDRDSMWALMRDTVDKVTDVIG